MHQGRKQLGGEVSLTLLCRDSSGVPADPDAAPTLEVYSSSGKPVSGRKVPTLDPLATTGLFRARLYLDEKFSAGRYHAVFRYAVSSSAFVEVLQFEIPPGGHGGGHVLAVFGYERPHATYLVQQRSGGRLYKGKNPRA